MFGGKPIVHRDHGGAALRGNLAADHVVRVEIADHPSAAVKEDQQRQRSGSGTIYAKRHPTGVCARADVCNVRQRRDGRPKPQARVAIVLSRQRSRNGVSGWEAERGELIERGADLWIEDGQSHRRYQTTDAAAVCR